ncbi:Calcium-binding protein 8 [Galemys pyrenaicus]|uniref:Calcium-binding protein 8 n=1 Tax=Galemys pyrenaicus TaxID=202257 RepID=A0A8J5ZZK7_GALPY|nr:Calcium-binding protein 8 [Galemys pyrenaicus]
MLCAGLAASTVRGSAPPQRAHLLADTVKNKNSPQSEEKQEFWEAQGTDATSIKDAVIAQKSELEGILGDYLCPPELQCLQFPMPCPLSRNCNSQHEFDMQRITLEELKHILYHAFRDHLTMKDIENIIINEEESLNETSGNCQTEFEGVHSQKQNRQTCVRKSLICAFAMAFIISVMLIAANQILRSGME